MDCGSVYIREIYSCENGDETELLSRSEDSFASWRVESSLTLQNHNAHHANKAYEQK